MRNRAAVPPAFLLRLCSGFFAAFFFVLTVTASSAEGRSIRPESLGQGTQPSSTDPGAQTTPNQPGGQTSGAKAGAAAAGAAPNVKGDQTSLPGLNGKSAHAPPEPASTAPAAGKQGVQGGDSKSASGAPMHLGPLAPSPAPAGIATGRRRIGVALGGGGALAMNEVGVLQWMEEHHVPVDVIAGTSMGAMIAALYSTGKTVPQLKVVMTDDVFNSVFRFESAYKSRSFRRREESRELPNALTIGLKHGISFRNSVLSDQGLNAFLDRQFLRYDDQTDFNDLPIPLRTISTDLNDAEPVTFARGSIPDAVRASLSIPGVYPPFELNGHEYIDGGVLDNLPVDQVKAMNADVVIAVSLPLPKVNKGDLGSVIGVLQRSFGAAIEGFERIARAKADVVILPDVTGFNESDYLKTVDLAKRGYEAAEASKEKLLPYAVSDAEWLEYMAHRHSLERGPAGNLLRVRVTAPNLSARRAAEQRFAPLVGKPTDTKAIEAVLDQLRSDGRYDADYTVGYESVGGQPSDRPIVLVNVVEKKTGPPFLNLGFNVEAAAGDVTRGTVQTILLQQDLGGYGSELRSQFEVGFMTHLRSEYYRHLATFSNGPTRQTELFAAPRLEVLREPYYIYSNQSRIAERQLQRIGGGVDVGFGNQLTREFRVGWSEESIRWKLENGSDGAPEILGTAQRVRARYSYDTQDQATVSKIGLHSINELGYLYHAASSENAPYLTSKSSISRTYKIKNTFEFNAEGGTLFNRQISQPLRYTLGGPTRLGASAVDEYRGTDYFLLRPAYLRQVASLPAPLGQSIYFAFAYEAGRIRAPDASTQTRQDVLFGIVAETPLGVITFTPAIGDAGRRKLIFTVGRVF